MLYEHVRRLHMENIEFSLLCSQHSGVNNTLKKYCTEILLYNSLD